MAWTKGHISSPRSDRLFPKNALKQERIPQRLKFANKRTGYTPMRQGYERAPSSYSPGDGFFGTWSTTRVDDMEVKHPSTSIDTVAGREHAQNPLGVPSASAWTKSDENECQG